MRSSYDPWQQHTDRFTLLLSLFFLVLLVLLLYLVKIDKDIRNYDRYHEKIEMMRELDYQFENYLSKTYRYIAYDEITQLEKRFEEALAFLNRPNIIKKFEPDIYRQIKKIEKEYTLKKFYFEDFKALNARVTNSIYFLYDLRKTLEKRLMDDPDKKMLVDNIFFSISQILMDIPYDKARLSKELDKLSTNSDKEKLLIYFLQHSRQFLLDVDHIKEVQQKINQIPLLESLEQLLEGLTGQYNQDRNWQTIIALSFFIFAFIILVLLVLNYRRMRKNTRELQAFQYAIENSDNAIVVTNVQREIQYVNEAFELRSGYTKEEVLGKNPNILKSGLLSSVFYKELNETLNRGEIWQGELINRRKNGSILYEKASIIPIYINGELVQYLAVKLDITEYKEQQQRLKQAAAVYEMIGDGILVTDKEKHILSVNPAFVKIFGYTEEELIGKEPMIIRTLKEDIYFYRQVWDQLLRQNRWSGKLHNQAKDGTIIPVWLTLTVVRDEKGEIENFIAIYTNLKDIIATQEKAEYLAYHDSLTGLPNRAYFDLRIVDILNVARTSDQQVAILFIDLDRFKVINDTLGHSVGDEMLVELAGRMQKIFDKNVLFARMGGDEFVVTCILEDGKKEVEEMAGKLLSVIREPVHVYDYYLNTTASIGIALFPDDGMDKYEIVKYADSAMYAAKEKGKDNYQFYTKQLSLDVQTRLNLEQELLHALERKELYVEYQPQYLLETGEVKGAEALLRWDSGILGKVSPDDFIAIAEETGVIVKIGYFVFEEACKAYKKWRDEGFLLERVAINISAVQFREEYFLEKLKDILVRTGVEASAIEIEITERFIMEYSTTNLTILEDLRALGCQISIDDFGTGYSSMSYMKQLPLDTVKIDKSFIVELPGNTHDAEVSKAIIALSKSLGYKVVAEGIENAAQEQFLRENKCDFAQGFYFAEPMDEKQFLDFLKEKGIKNPSHS